MAQYKMLDGNAAAVQAVSMAGVSDHTSESHCGKAVRFDCTGNAGCKIHPCRIGAFCFKLRPGSPAHRSQGGYSDSIGGPRAHA